MNADYEYKTIVYDRWNCQSIDKQINEEADDGWVPFKTQFEFDSDTFTISGACILFQREKDYD